MTSKTVHELVRKQIVVQNELIEVLFNLIMTFDPEDFVKGSNLLDRGLIIRMWVLMEEIFHHNPENHFSNLRIVEKQQGVINTLEALLRNLDEHGDSNDQI